MTRSPLPTSAAEPTAAWTGAVVVLVVSLGLTWFAWARVSSDERAAIEANFRDRVDDAQDRILKRMIASEQVLWGVRAIFAGSERVERGEFREYVTALALGEHSPGIQAIGFVRFVPAAQLPQHLAEVRQTIPEYVIHPSGDRDAYAPIMFLAPFEGRNLIALGYDMLTEPVRTAAMEASRDRAQAVLSGRVRLVQEPDRELQAGVLMYVPVYANGHAPPLSPSERRESILGWTYAAFRMGELMDGTLNPSEDLALHLYDGEQLTPDALLYDSKGDAPHLPPRPGLVARRTMLIGERTWTLVVEAQPRFGADLVSRSAAVIGLGGSFVSVLAAALAFMVLGARARAERRALAMNRELLEAHAALEQSELRFRRMADQAPVLIWTAGPEGGCDWFNRPWLEFTGRAMAASTGERWAEAVHAEDRERVLEARRDGARAREPFKVEYRLRRADGLYRWVLDVGVPQLDEQQRFSGLIGSCVDIHDHREREALLFESELRLRLATRGGDLATWDADVLRGRVLLSERFSELLGLHTPRAEWTFDELRARLHPDDLAPALDAHLAHERGDASGLRGELRLRREDGAWAWVQVSGMVVRRDAEGAPVRVAGTMVDVTERKRAEAERAELAARYVQAERSAALGTLAGGMAHEINNPLAVVISNLSYALEQLGHALDERGLADVKEALGDATQSAGRVRDLVAELSSLTATQRSSRDRASLEAVFERVKPSTLPPHASLDVTIAPDLPLVLGSLADLSRLFGGLLANAFLATDPARPNHVRVRAERDGDVVRVVLEDQGVGMEPEISRRVFDPFFTTRMMVGGKGLGGPVAMAIARSVGGDISLTSEAGRGTTVTVTLPMAEG